ncbi:class I SAM-dependent methyltransferase [Anatilimnocola floriformis]|uniref:class I SAM-dependent methyltransferase n=1 Tax=Anatilimnocola floriformis TaxID=2948575 RepID=UPI0020C494D2|nr:class I SAM-dependent methyltransferase [Anatilimnocola floriformis]
MSLGDFSPQADAYRQARPTYPAELVEQLIADACLPSGAAVADFGAGTGIFTQLLIDRGLQVTALEPNEQMRSQNAVPAACWTAGTFENSGLADGSQRWAVAAQAFHWADPPRALPELRRILAPGSLFTVVWNNRANRDSEILGWTEATIRRLIPEFDEAYRNRPWPTILASTGDFTFTTHRTATHTIRMSRARYLTLWRSHNRLTITAGPERFAQLLQEIESHLDQLGLAEVDVPYRCEAWSARRSD